MLPVRPAALLPANPGTNAAPMQLHTCIARAAAVHTSVREVRDTLQEYFTIINGHVKPCFH